MHEFGFASATTQTVDVIEFFKKNMHGFGRMKGLDDQDISFSLLSKTHSCDIAVCSKPIRLTACGSGDSVLLPVRPALSITLNENFVAELSEGSPEMNLFLLWNAFAKCMRLWVIEVDRIHASELLPASIMRSFPGTELICKELDNMFMTQGWTPEFIRWQYDAAAIGQYVSRLVCSESDIVERLEPREIAEVIFSARRSNWDRLTATN